METLSRLNNLVGKHGLLKIQSRDVGFVFLSVYPAADLPTEADDEAFQTAISQSTFQVRFDEGTLIDGNDRKVVSGHYISSILGSY